MNSQYDSENFIVRCLWKSPKSIPLQLTLSKVSHTGLMKQIDRGITGAFYKVVDAERQVHRINKYEVRNFVARRADSLDY